MNPANSNLHMKCGLGAIKTNIGHLEGAAGVAGLIKVLLSFRYQKIPGNINFNKINPLIDFSDTPYYLINQTQPWIVENNKSRVAGISSFWFGGTNSHIILE